MLGGKITNNTATGDGGGVCMYGTAKMYMGEDFGNTPVISNNTASGKSGGGVALKGTNNEFIMYGGEISGNIASNSYGGAVCINSSNSSFIMNGGIIGEDAANTARNGGGVSVVIGSFTMNDGKISGNIASSNGGGVFMSNSSASFIMNGGIIGEDAANTARNGGGVYVSAGTFSMNKGVISANEATSNGGGVYVTSSSSSFVMTGGIIGGGNADIGNTSTSGGGVYVNSQATFTMSNGAIIANTATTNGGGVYVNGTFAMADSEIDINTAAVNGGGIYISSSGSMKITGSSIILGNKATSGDGGGIYTENTTDYSNIETADGTIFYDNRASIPIEPQSNASSYTNIGFSISSIYDHPLNNYDINALVLIPEYKVMLTIEDESGVNWVDLGNIPVTFKQDSSRQTAIFSSEIEVYDGSPAVGDYGIEKLSSGTWAVGLDLPYGYDYEVFLNDASVGKSVTISSETMTIIEIKVSKTQPFPWGKWIYLFR